MSNEAKAVMVQALVLSTLRHNGETIYPGTDDEAVIVTMSRKDCDRLAKLGAVAEVQAVDEVLVAGPTDGAVQEPDGTDAGGTDTPTDSAEPDSDEPVSYVESLAAAMRQLGESDFNADKTPKVSALEKLIGAPVSAEQRDAAWALLQETNTNGEAQ